MHANGAHIKMDLGSHLRLIPDIYYCHLKWPRIKHWCISTFDVKRFSMIVAEDVWYERLIHFWIFFNQLKEKESLECLEYNNYKPVKQFLFPNLFCWSTS